MVHPAMVASFRQSDCNEYANRRRPPDLDPGARAPIAHPPYGLSSPETAEKEKMAKGAWRNPLKGLRFVGGETFDFASPGLDFPSPKLGIYFPKAWIFLPKGLDFPSPASRRFAQKENSAAKTELDEQ